jgi:hypothetical protein
MQELKIVNYNKTWILLRISVCLFIFSSLGSHVQGSIFGFDSGPCLTGTYHDEKNHLCFYCPEGTKEKDESFSINKKCMGNATIGLKCSKGESVLFDKEKMLCVYCEAGYVFGSNNYQCYPG